MDSNIKVLQGDILLVDLSGGIHSEQSKTRPCVVIQNNVGNNFSPTTIIVPLTSEMKRLHLPTHTVVCKDDATGLAHDSMVLAEQIRVIDKKRIVKKLGKITNQSAMEKIFNAYLANFGMIGKESTVNA